MTGSLSVCWSVPRRTGRGRPLLSFLSPADEEALGKTGEWDILFARELSQTVREEARALYFDITSRMGTAILADGRTLRESMARPGHSSPWWYHPVTFRDPEGDPAYEWLIALLTIRRAAKNAGCDRLVLYHAPREVAQVLRSHYRVEERSPRGWLGGRTYFARALASRAKTAVDALRASRAAKTLAAPHWPRFDLLFSGFWDWSVWWDAKAGALSDRYFKGLPEELKGRGLKRVGWLAWL